MGLWVSLGMFAIMSALLNLIWSFRGKEAKWFRYASLSFTALTLCAFYHQSSMWVIQGDWSALEDVVPALSNILWILTAASILINSISLFKKPKQ